MISLRDSKRRAHISSQVNSLNINYEFFDAIYGKGLTESEIREYCDSEALERNPRWLNEGAIGCALSHYFVYRKIVDDDIERAIVVEDDMVLTDRFLKILQFLETRDLHEEIIMLYYRAFNKVTFSSQGEEIIDKAIRILRPFSLDDIPMTTGCYYITKPACEKLIKIILPIRVTADSWKYLLVNAGIDSFNVVYPRPVSDAGFKSEINYHEKYSGRMVQWANKMLGNFNFFPVNLLLRVRRKWLENKMSRFVITTRKSKMADQISKQTN